VHELVASVLLYFLQQHQSLSAMGGLTDVSEFIFLALDARCRSFVKRGAAVYGS
jgi:hypothetical protein